MNKVTGKKQRADEYAVMLDVVPDIVYRIDPDGLFTYLNNSVEWIGYTVDELIGKHFSTIIHPEDVDFISRDKVLPVYSGKVTGIDNSPRLFDERRTGERSTKNLVFRLMPKKTKGKQGLTDSKKRGPLYGEVMSSGLYEDTPDSVDRKFTGTVGILRDISERVKLLEDKVELQEQLHQSQKMEAIGQLAGGIAHDFNNLLGAISGYAETISRKFGPDSPMLKKYTGTILSAAKRAADLTSNLLSFARKGNNRDKPININEVITDTIQLLTHSISKEVVIVKELHAENPNIYGDPNQIQNALINIALNAYDAMPQGGRLIFNTKNVYIDERNNKFNNGKLTMGFYIVISITDTGTGMDDEIKSRIFEPFFTTKEIGKGTGLGLASVYGIIEAHKGIVDVESEPGKGTTFIIHLPVIVKTAKDETVPSKRIIKEDGEIKGHVVVIDDEKYVLDSCTEMLESLGYSVSTFYNGVEAYHYYKRFYKEIDLVIIDMIMPMRSGRDCFLDYKKINPDINALLSSGYNLDQSAQMMLKEGVAGFIKKPFIASELSKAISLILHKVEK